MKTAGGGAFLRRIGQASQPTCQASTTRSKAAAPDCAMFGVRSLADSN